MGKNWFLWEEINNKLRLEFSSNSYYLVPKFFVLSLWMKWFFQNLLYYSIKHIVYWKSIKKKSKIWKGVGVGGSDSHTNLYMRFCIQSRPPFSIIHEEWNSVFHLKFDRI